MKLWRAIGIVAKANSTSWQLESSNTSLIIVIIEVKARATNNFGSPLEAVTLAKQRKLRIATKKFLQSRPEISGEARFDIAAVLGTKIEVLENAF